MTAVEESVLVGLLLFFCAQGFCLLVQENPRCFQIRALAGKISKSGLSAVELRIQVCPVSHASYYRLLITDCPSRSGGRKAKEAAAVRRREGDLILEVREVESGDVRQIQPTRQVRTLLKLEID